MNNVTLVRSKETRNREYKENLKKEVINVGSSAESVGKLRFWEFAHRMK